MPIVMFSTTSDLMRPIKFRLRWARCRAAYHEFIYPVLIRRLCCCPSHCRNPALVTGATDGGKTEHACSSWSKKKPAEE